MNRFKKIWSFILAITLSLALVISNPMKVNAEGNSTNKIEAIFVLDASNSMKRSDPKNIRYDAFKLFVDMCHLNGDSIGLVAFGEGLSSEVKPIEIVNQGTKEELKKKVTQIPLTNYTDIGLGLKKAVENITKDSGKIPLIVLLSDGKHDPLRDKTEADKDLNSAVDFAKNNGIPIYTIGLNVNGEVDQNLLNRISAETGGKTSIIDNAKDLPRIFGQVFAEGSKLKMIPGETIGFNGGYQEVKISMPDENVVEANIAIMSEGVQDIKIFNESGEEQPLNSDKIQLVKSENYSLLKFINPPGRNWVLKIKGNKGAQGVFNYIYNYDLDLQAGFSKTKGVKVGETIKANAQLISNGKSVADTEFYNGLTGKLLVKDKIKGGVKEIPLNNTGSSFEGEYLISEEGDFELSIRVDGNSLYRESSPVKIEFEVKAPVIVPPVEPEKNELVNQLKDYLGYMAAGLAILSLLIILSVLRGNRKKDRKTKLKQAVKDIPDVIKPKEDIFPASDRVITLSEAVEMSERALVREEKVKKDEPVQRVIPMPQEIPVKKEVSAAKETPAKKENLKKESKIVGGEFSGRLMITIKERDSEITTHPIFKNLSECRDSITLSHLLSDLPEFKETQKINFYPGAEGTLVIKNSSNVLVRRNGIDIGNDEVTIDNEEKIAVTLKKTPKIIYIQYFEKRK